MWPQYLGCLLTGVRGAEPTYLGCHGYLLDIGGKDYSVVAERLGVVDKLPPPPFARSWETLGTLEAGVAARTGLSPSTIVTMGVHDSNAALVPYFVRGFENFVVQDSGTWVVSMSPREEAQFESGELGKEVFFNRSVYGAPVKTTIFRGGAEFDFYSRKVLAGRPHPGEIDIDVLRSVLEKGKPSPCRPSSAEAAFSLKASHAWWGSTRSSATTRTRGASWTSALPSRAARPRRWRAATASK